MPRPLTRRQRVRLASVLGTVVVPVALACVSGCSDDAAPTPPSRAQIATMLRAHGAAVLAGDSTGFLAGTAPGAYRTRQRAVVANLSRVPLASWTYRLGPAVTQAEAQRAVRAKYDASAVIVKVELRYAIRGVDTAPTSKDLWWTVVRRNGRPAVVSDSDLRNDGGESWRGPWDFARLQVTRGRAALVLGHPQDAALDQAVADTVDRAVPAVTAVWGTGWTRRVAVVVPFSAGELRSALGPTAGAPADTGAIARTDSTDVVSGRSVGQRIVIVPDQLRRLTATGRRIVLQHEITHLATAARTTAGAPRWLTEGFAEYVGNLGSGQPVRVAAAELAAAVRRDGVAATLPADADFGADETAAVAYQSSWLACRYLASRFGQDGLVRFYRAVGAPGRAADEAVTAALRSVARWTPAQFLTGWRAYVRTQLGGDR